MHYPTMDMYTNGLQMGRDILFPNSSSINHVPFVSVSNNLFVQMAKKKIKKHTGKCVGTANGEVVVESTSINRVMATLLKDYPKAELSISSIPKENIVLIL